MFKKPWVQQLVIGVLVWVVGSALWGFISNSFHIPGFNWSYIGVTSLMIFWIFIWQLALPFAKYHLNLYIARKNLEFQREQQELETHKTTLQTSVAKEPLLNAPTK